MGTEIEFYKTQSYEMDGAGCCTTLWMYLIPLKKWLKW